MEEDDFISKTRRKRQMHELQSIGEALVQLSPEKLARIDLPEELRDAIADARRFTKHEARRRQMQYIGRIMRDIDPGPIVESLNALEAPSKHQTAILHLVEQWRRDLLDDPEAVNRFVQAFPEADPHRLRALIEAANHGRGTSRQEDDRRASRPPRQFRELFHVLNAILQDHSKRHP